MVKVFEGTENEFYMDGYLKTNLDRAKEVIKKDWDMLFCYDGYEGSGKSVKAMQDAYYCDPTLTVDRIVFTPYQFRKAIMSSEKYQSVVYDEAYTGLSSRATMSLINRTLISMLAEIRQRNLFVFVVMPTFFDLDKYVALWRSRLLIHVYTGDNFQRGYFSFYNIDRKKDLYINGKKYYNYSKPKHNFNGRFTNHYTVNKEEYLKRKKESLIAREKAKEEAEVKRQIEDKLFERIMELDPKLNITHKTKMNILNMPSSTYFLKLKRYEENREFL